MSNLSISPAKLKQTSISELLQKSAKSKIDSIDVLQSIGSTNSFLLERGLEMGRARICVAEEQAAGRGRRGNEWLSAPNKNIMMSLSWSFSHWPKTITGLGLAVALVVTERLNNDYGLAVKIKWPNDLLIDDKKLAGVLIDIVGQTSGVCNVVIGLGLNVHQPDWSASASPYDWQDLHSLNVHLNRNQFIADIASDCLVMLKGFELNGFAPLAAIWNEHSSYADRMIRVSNQQREVVGIMLGVDENGGLLVVDDKGKTHVFVDSNASVRLLS